MIELESPPVLSRTDSFPLLDLPQFHHAHNSSHTRLDIQPYLQEKKQLKKICRTGFPIYSRPENWHELIYHNELTVPKYNPTYETLKEDVFQTKTNKNKENNNNDPVDILSSFHQIVPDFGSPVHWTDPKIPLNHKRIHYAKTLLCVISNFHPDLIYAPYLPDLLIIFLLQGYSESTTWNLMNKVIHRSKQDQWFFPLGAKLFLAFTHTFQQYLAKEMPQVSKHMDKLGVDSKLLFSNWIQRLFTDYLPLPIIMRIMDAWVHEGQKVFLRIGLAIFKLHKKQLKTTKNKEDFLSKLTESMTLHTNEYELMNIAFDFHLVRGKIFQVQTAQANIITSTKGEYILPQARVKSHFRLPQFDEKSSEILTSPLVYALWSFLPEKYKLLNPLLLYSSSLHGYSLSTLIKKSETQSSGESAVLVIVRDDTNGIFGTFLTNPIGAIQSKKLTPIDARCFVFSLKPNCECYKHKTERMQEEQRLLQSENLCTGEEKTNSNETFLTPHHNKSDQHNASTATTVDNASSGEIVNDSAEVVRSRDSYILWDDDLWGIADEKGYAFAVDHELRTGITKSTHIYNNPPLTESNNGVEGKFKIFNVEVFGFQGPILT